MIPFSNRQHVDKRKKNSTSESHYWLTNKCLSPKKKRNRFKYFDPTTGRYFCFVFSGLVSSISDDLGAPGEIRCRGSRRPKKYRREFSNMDAEVWSPTTKRDVDTVCCWLYSRTIRTMTSNQIIETRKSLIRQGQWVNMKRVGALP